MSGASGVGADDDARLEAMVGAWLEAREAGEAPDLAELCGERLDLLPQLRALVALAGGLPGSERDDAAARDPLLGRRLGGRYRLTARLGAGGMGLVYGAHDEQLGRDVAVKVLDELFAADAGRIERFRREARGLAALDDPHIVAVHDFDLTGRPPFLVMDRIAGFDLSALVRALREATHGKVPTPAETVAAVASLLRAPAPALSDLMSKPWPQIVAIVGVQMGNALAAAHGVGVVHRDVKPSNFMLDAQGRVRLLDFGLARRETDASLTRSDTRLGTPLYMAPEQVRGEDASTASDVYSLGATLYELLCLQPPFPGRGTELENAILFADPALPRPLRSRLPRDLGVVCLAAMHKQPARRYPSARALVADLERFLRFEPVAARALPLPGPVRAAIGAYRKFRVALVAGAVLVLVVGAGALVAGQFFGGERERRAVARQVESRRLHAGLSPVLGFGGGREDRLRDPRRVQHLAALDALLALDDADTLARFLRLWVRGEEDPVPAVVASDRSDLESRLGRPRLERLLERVALPVQQRNRNDDVAMRAAMQAALREIDAEAWPMDAVARRLHMIVALQIVEVDPDQRRAMADAIRKLAVEDELLRGRTAFTCVALATAAQVADDLRAARDLYIECDRLCPGEPSTLMNLARTYRRLGQPQTARPYSEAALAAVAVPHANLLEQHALVLIALRDFAGAEAVLARFAVDDDSRVQQAFTRTRLRLEEAGLLTDDEARRARLEEAAASLRALHELVEQGRLTGRQAQSAATKARIVGRLLEDAHESRVGFFLDLLLNRDGTGTADPFDIELLERLAAAARDGGETRWAAFLTVLVQRLRRLEQDGVRLR